MMESHCRFQPINYFRVVLKLRWCFSIVYGRSEEVRPLHPISDRQRMRAPWEESMTLDHVAIFTRFCPWVLYWQHSQLKEQASQMIIKIVMVMLGLVCAWWFFNAFKFFNIICIFKPHNNPMRWLYVSVFYLMNENCQLHMLKDEPGKSAPMTQ